MFSLLRGGKKRFRFSSKYLICINDVDVEFLLVNDWNFDSTLKLSEKWNAQILNRDNDDDWKSPKTRAPFMKKLKLRAREKKKSRFHETKLIWYKDGASCAGMIQHGKSNNNRQARKRHNMCCRFSRCWCIRTLGCAHLFLRRPSWAAPDVSVHA